MPQLKLFPEQIAELYQYAAQGQMQTADLYRFDTLFFEPRAQGWTIDDMRGIRWFAQFVNQMKTPDDTLCSQKNPPTIADTEAWVVDMIEFCFLPYYPHVHYKDLEAINALSRGLIRLNQDREEVLAWHIDRMVARTDPGYWYAPRNSSDAGHFVDEIQRGVLESPQFSSILMLDRPLYLRPAMTFYFDYLPSPRFIEAIDTFHEGALCVEQTFGMRLTLRGRLFKKLMNPS